MLTLKSVSIGLGFLLVIIYLPFIFNYKGWKKDMEGMLENKALIRVLALLMMVIAFLLLKVHNTFEKAWPLAISIAGWAFLLKALLMFWFPDWGKKMWKNFAKNEWIMVISGIVGLALGVFYEYLGFYIF